MTICSHREALQYIAITSRGVLWVDRYNVIRLEEAGSNPSGKTIKLDNAFTYPKITLDKPIKQITTDFVSIGVSGTASEIYNSVLDFSGTHSFWINYNSPAIDATATVSNGTIVDVDYYAYCCYITINTSVPTTLIITGKVLDIVYTPYVTSSESTGEEIYINNPLVTSLVKANLVNNWVRNDKLKKTNFEYAWRMNPSMEIRDIVDSENQFSTFPNTRILRQRFEFKGGLKGTTLTRG
jgi:hypothetical protein